MSLARRDPPRPSAFSAKLDEQTRLQVLVMAERSRVLPSVYITRMLSSAMGAEAATRMVEEHYGCWGLGAMDAQLREKVSN